MQKQKYKQLSPAWRGCVSQTQTQTRTKMIFYENAAIVNFTGLSQRFPINLIFLDLLDVLCRVPVLRL